MSFSIYISTMNNDDENMFDRAIVERAFGDIAVDQTGGYWNLRSPDGRLASTTIFIKDKPKISGFSANRPPSYPGFPKFWNAMFEILCHTPTILYWPAAKGPHPSCCVADPALLPDLPGEWTNALGKPAIVSSGAEIEAAIALTGN
jgi:hypothetical protein